MWLTGDMRNIRVIRSKQIFPGLMLGEQIQRRYYFILKYFWISIFQIFN